jgi:hypothetical protein
MQGISFKDFLVDVEIEVCEYDATQRFTAVSHVWADGLGNPDENSIPRCVLPMLCGAIAATRNPMQPYMGEDGLPRWPSQKQVEAAATRQKYISRDREPDWFWMDTLCIPNDEERILKKKAIASMKDIYGKANTVLVFEPSMTSFWGASSGIRSCRMRTWAECCADVLGSVGMVSHFSEFSEDRCPIDDEKRRLWAYQEGALTRNLMVLYAEGPVRVSDMITGVIDNQNRLGPVGFTAYHLGNALSLMLDWQQFKRFPGANFMFTWNSCVTRSASHEGDESIVLAGMLGLSPAELFGLPVADRAKAFYKMVPAIPPGMLFTGGEKYDDVGWRWADKRLMTAYIPKKGHHRHFSCDDVFVSYPGYMVCLPYEASIAAGAFYFRDVIDGQWLSVRLDHVFPYHPTIVEEWIAIIFQEPRSSMWTKTSSHGKHQGVGVAVVTLTQNFEVALNDVYVRLEGYGQMWEIADDDENLPSAEDQLGHVVELDDSTVPAFSAMPHDGVRWHLS